MIIQNKVAAANGTLLDDLERPGSLAARRAEIDQPYIAPLERRARNLARVRGESVPSFNPRSGGVDALALFRSRTRREQPQRVRSSSASTTTTRRPITRPRRTPRRAWTTSCRSLERDPVVGAQPRAEGSRQDTRPEARRAKTDVIELLDLLEVRVVVLRGIPAQDAWVNACGDADTIFACPHSANQAWNNLDAITHRPNRELTLQTFARAADLIRHG